MNVKGEQSGDRRKAARFGDSLVDCERHKSDTIVIIKYVSFSQLHRLFHQHYYPTVQ